MAISTITTASIADNAITAAKIPAGVVDVDLQADAVTASHIAANAVGSSELADDAVLPANIAYLGDGTGKLSGTITGQQLRLGTAFTLTDDLTVNGDLTLSKVRADDTGQSLTQNTSANRTLTGTGTLRMGHVTEKTSISGMTGTLDSSVTFPDGAGIYETGTWTPTWTSLSGTLGATIGRYTKIGNRVFIEIEQSAGAANLASTANSTNIDGYPFVPAYSTTCTVCQNNATGALPGYMSASGMWTPTFSSWDNFRVSAVYITAE